jgi:hypothetical protein
MSRGNVGTVRTGSGVVGFAAALARYAPVRTVLVVLLVVKDRS